MTEPADGPAARAAIMASSGMSARTYARIYDAPRPWMSPVISGLREPESFHHGDFGISRLTPFIARSLTRHILTEWHVLPETVDAAELVASELVTNAVQSDAGRVPRGNYVPFISVTLWQIKELVVIEVSDENERPPVMKAADPESDSGRGLLIVEAVGREWSYYYPQPGRKTVYCIL
jgi:hypothetical protein